MDASQIKEIEIWYDKNSKIYEQLCYEIESLIKKIIKSENIPFHSITYRVKDKISFLDKCQKEKYDNPLNQIMDIAGVRIIAYINSDVKAICDIIEREFSIDKVNSMNQLDKMEENQFGYLSVHFIAKLSEARISLPEYKIYNNLQCEIQVRTLLQHAWAEIEHDRNYKFGGVLPRDIKRRFYLSAGLLEMADREFQNLSDDIDRYGKEVKEKANHGELDIEIDSTSLFEYMCKKFDFEWINKTFNDCDKLLISELKNYGLNKLQDLEKIIPDDYFKMSEQAETNFTGILRDFMIINDYKKYFEECWQKSNWRYLDNGYRIYSKYKLPMDEIINKYGIEL